MIALTAERLNRLIDECDAKCRALDPAKLAELDENMAVEFDEHFQYQELQAQFHTQGLLTTEAAQIVYSALGEVGSHENGGWAKDTNTAKKCIVTQLMGEMLHLRIASRA